MSSVIEINSIDDLAGYRLLWKSLLNQTRHATFFQSLDWLEVYWRHFGAEQQLRVLIVYAGDEPAGILPLVVRTETNRLGAVRTLTYPLHDWGTFYGPIGPNPTVTLKLGMEHIRQTPRDWDVIDLRWVDAEAADAGRTPRAMEAAGFGAFSQAWDQSSIVELQGTTWDDYFAGRKGEWRSNVRRCEKKLAAKGEVTHVRYRPQGVAHGDCDPRWDLYDACVAIAAASWQGGSTNGTTLSHADVAEFFRDMHVAACRAGCVDLNLLLIDGVPVAFSYNYHFRGQVFGLRLGFDPQLCPDGAGTVLTARVLKDSIARGDHSYDMGAGSWRCKRNWLTKTVVSRRYTHFAATPKSQLLRLKRLAAQWRGLATTPAEAARAEAAADKPAAKLAG